MLKVDQYDTSGYHVFKLLERIVSSSRITELRELFSRYLTKHKKPVAIVFPPDSRLNSEAIGVVVSCIKQAHALGRDLALVSVGQDVLAVLEMFRLKRLARVFSSEEELAAG